ncbi:hypothetical protein [Cupriavidus agavae]|uniref:Uncharacterized protein n=1 Tax=Cupriavidus agavae TaxID=1001822 RepID=A0A4V2FI19_9BURK|nr:hypothetical protein [Cupriavidus agavae]RZT42239.1 hypothetical protein EV147_1262 [Cupriavidus agavae]
MKLACLSDENFEQTRAAVLRAVGVMLVFGYAFMFYLAYAGLTGKLG